MKEKTTHPTLESSPTWEHLETWVRNKMREWLQDLLEAEVDELLGRQSERRKAVDAAAGYRSGHGTPRRLTLSCGTVAVRRPRVRGLLQRFRCLNAPELAGGLPRRTIRQRRVSHGTSLGGCRLTSLR
jgi:hypothetical protein